MPLFSLVATCTGAADNVYLLSSYTETRDLEGGKLMKEFVAEVAKDKTPQLNQSKGSFKKDSFTVFYINHSDLPITLLAFTNKNYMSDLAYKCLVEYETLIEAEFPEKELNSLKRDANRNVKGSDRLVETFYSGASILLNEGARKRVEETVQRAEVNLEKTRKLRDDTDKMTYYAQKMKNDGEVMSGQRAPPKQSNCHLF